MQIKVCRLVFVAGFRKNGIKTRFSPEKSGLTRKALVFTRKALVFTQTTIAFHSEKHSNSVFTRKKVTFDLLSLSIGEIEIIISIDQ